MDRWKQFLGLGLLLIASAQASASVEEFVALCEMRDLPHDTAVTIRSLEKLVVGFSNKKLGCQELGEKVAKLTEINLPGNTFLYYEVVDLEPIALFPQIKVLRIPFQKIHSLETLAPLALEVLDIEGTNVSLTPLTRLQKVRELKVSLNALSEVDVLGFLTAVDTLEISTENSDSVELRKLPPYLRRLTVNGGGVKSFKRTESRYLQHVELNEVRSRNLDWLKLSAASLEGLAVRGGQVGDFRAIGNFENLSSLVLSSVGLEEIDFLSRLRKLQSLDLSSNKLSTVESLRALTQLKTLSLGWNQIYDTSALEALFKLEELELQNNRLVRFSLGYLERLRKLNLSQNQMWALPEANIADAVYRLRELHLSGNDVRAIAPSVVRLAQLQRLSLDSNNLRDVSALSGLPNLEILNLQDNKISDVSSFAVLQKLQELYLGDNVLPASFVCPVAPASVCFY